MTDHPFTIFECVVNVSEGRNQQFIDDLLAAGGLSVLDVHSDPYHNRSVLTLGGALDPVTAAARAIARIAIARINVTTHVGAHPWIGAVDVVPFVHLAGWPLSDGQLEKARAARNAFAEWVAAELGVPSFYYGPERTLPDVRRTAWTELAPDCGPPGPHPTAGAIAVGARRLLVAYNIWLEVNDLGMARRIAREIRSAYVRALGLQVGTSVQVSCNLIAPTVVGPGAVFDAVSRRASVERSELVGLVPHLVLAAEPSHRWAELSLDPSATIEARLQLAGLDGGRFG